MTARARRVVTPSGGDCASRAICGNRPEVRVTPLEGQAAVGDHARGSMMWVESARMRCAKAAPCLLMHAACLIRRHGCSLQESGGMGTNRQPHKIGSSAGGGAPTIHGRTTASGSRTTAGKAAALVRNPPVQSLVRRRDWPTLSTASLSGQQSQSLPDPDCLKSTL
jgi:hypothetical protein